MIISESFIVSSNFVSEGKRALVKPIYEALKCL